MVPGKPTGAPVVFSLLTELLRTRAIWKCRCFFSRCFTDKRTTFVISYGSEQVQMNRIRMFLQQSHQPLPTCGQHHGTDLLGGEWKPGPQDAGAQRVWQDDPGDWGWNEQWQRDCKGSLTDLAESWWGKPPTRQGVIPVHYFCIFLFDPWYPWRLLLSTQHFRCRLHTWRSLNLHKPCFMCSSARLHLDSIGSRNGGGCGPEDGDTLMVGCALNLPMKGKSWFTFGACLWTDKATVYHIRTVSTLYLDWNTSISESWCPFDRGLGNFPSADVTFWGGVIIEILVICLDEHNIYQVRMGTPEVYSNHGWSSTRRFTAKVNLTKKKQGSDWWDSLEDGWDCCLTALCQFLMFCHVLSFRTSDFSLFGRLQLSSLRHAYMI